MSTVLREEAQQDNWGDKKDLLKRTICKGSSDEELELFIHACKRTGLDPFMKQIYAVKRWSSADKKEVMTMQTSIDGFRVIAERTGRYAPGPESKYEYDDKNQLLAATAFVKKLTLDGTWHTVSATAFWDEYCQKTKEGAPTQFWTKMPHVMLSKCAESLALRKAFPAELSGLYTIEEMTQASKVSGNDEALTIDHAQMLESAKKSEEDLMDELYDKTKEAKNRDKIPTYLNFCFTKTSKREFLEAAVGDTERFLEFFNKWNEKNNLKKPVESKSSDLLSIDV